MPKRTQILVRGIVQGVGFRPHVYTLARRRALRGQVCNNSAGVLIDVEGESYSIEAFISEIKRHPPPLSSVESVERTDDLDLAHYADFRIVESSAAGVRFTPVSPDVATCADCLAEMFDARDRRFRYPFINCVNCGPRFTIIESIPYDRARTTMRDFEMCEACRAEYTNPLHRRFHAEPTACPACGPRLSLTDARGCLIECDTVEAGDMVGHVRRLLLDGKIIAIKGIGGFHLTVDALDAEAVARLRGRKHREDKPFALMARTVAVVREFCHVSEEEENLLKSARRPIVLLAKKHDAVAPEAVAPKVNMLGFMLPYAPLHHLLFENLDRPLVFTSGNVSDEPICYEDAEAEERLGAIADYFWRHDRRIHMRADDSVTRVEAGREMMLRRARGYAPAPLTTSFKFGREILACGAELKNTFCLGREHHAFVSHHIGDLENLETLRSFTEGIEHYRRLFHLRPEIVAYDLHPEYLSTKHALALDTFETKIGVQHHHAHIASCMADNRIEGEVIGVALDGLGFGADGHLWGGEFFVADFTSAERVAHLDYVPLPGGAKAIREPWRMAAVYLQRAFGDNFLELDVPFVANLDTRAWATMRRMIETGTNSPRTSSMGRLFDAVAGLLCVRGAVNYEGQAAIELEMIADRACVDMYEFEIEDGSGVIKAEPVIRRAVEDLLGGLSAGAVSAKFHLGVAALIASVARRARDERQLGRVALSGGVFQNMFLLARVRHLLERDGFEVFTHRRVPTNDGGISLGQAAIANALVMTGRM
jgi:hydrogenase maturation protein HypF